MYKITKKFMFSASHQLAGLPLDHPCARLHGHNYIVEVVLEGNDLHGPGFVLDYRDLDVVKDWLNLAFDHKHLNDQIPKSVQPTAENLARIIFNEWREIPCLAAVRVSETPKTWAEFRPERP